MPSKGPIRTYTAKDLIDVCDTDEFKITETIFQDVSTAQPKWSTIYVELKPASQTPPFANKFADMRYDLTSGSVWFMIDKKGEVVNSPCKILIPANTSHFMLNINDNPVKYTIDVPGYLDMRSQFGIPIHEMKKKD
jgi:hypothetical protein